MAEAKQYSQWVIALAEAIGPLVGEMVMHRATRADLHDLIASFESDALGRDALAQMIANHSDGEDKIGTYFSNGVILELADEILSAAR